jgi:arabinogalactan oligomer/maltooligosaccharide transport system permease protein
MWLAYPFVMTVTMGAIASIPKEYIEAAYIDGSNIFTRFRKIMFPIISRPIFFAAILTTGASLQAFMIPLLINNGGPTAFLSFLNFPTALGNSNEVIVLYGYNRAWLDQQYGLATASFLIAVLILLVFAILWFYFIYKKGFSR